MRSARATSSGPIWSAGECPCLAIGCTSSSTPIWRRRFETSPAGWQWTVSASWMPTKNRAHSKTCSSLSSSSCNQRERRRRNRKSVPSMTRVLAQIRKELTQLRRDALTLALALALPAMLLLLLSTATSLSVRDIPVVVQDLDETPLSRQYIEQVAGSLAFRMNVLPDGMSANRALDRNLARAAIIIPPQFHRRIARGERAELQWLIDATDANTANVMRGKVAAITDAFNRTQLPGSPAAIHAEVR